MSEIKYEHEVNYFIDIIKKNIMDEVEKQKEIALKKANREIEDAVNGAVDKIALKIFKSYDICVHKDLLQISVKKDFKL